MVRTVPPVPAEIARSLRAAEQTFERDTAVAEAAKARARRLRAVALAEHVDAGLSFRQAAAVLGISLARVQQLVGEGRAARDEKQ